MAGKRSTPEQTVAKLRQVEVLTAQGKTVAEAVRAIGVTEPTYYRWRSEYGGLKLDQVKRLKQLEAENGRLRKAVADLTLEKLILKEATVRRYHYESHDQLRRHLGDFVAAYNFARRLRTLKGLTPYEHICAAWAKDPGRFTADPTHQMPGPNT